MFSNSIESFIILTIYLLIIVDVGLLIAIYFEIIKDKLKKRHYEKVLNNLKPKVLAYIKDENQLAEVEKLLKNYYSKIVAIDILVDYSEKNNVNISNKFINLEFVSLLIKKMERKVSVIYLRKLSFMRAETAYNTLLKYSQSQDLDISYMSFYGLSLIELPNDKKETVIEKLITSSIISDRIIEILNRFSLKFDEWLALLEREKTIEGKVVFLKNLMTKEEIKKEAYSDRIAVFLNDQKEVKISAILALSNSENEKYIDKLSAIYENEENWQVRMAVAKGFSHFRFESVKDLLLKMTNDREWWVRYDAIRSIIAMGDEGLFSLIDLSLDIKNKNISDLAYYFLNSNKDVYNTVKNIEG